MYIYECILITIQYFCTTDEDLWVETFCLLIKLYHVMISSIQIVLLLYCRNFSEGSKWLPGVITKVNGPVSFIIELQDSRLIRRHIDHVRKRYNEDIGSPPVTEDDFSPTIEPPTRSNLSLSRTKNSLSRTSIRSPYPSRVRHPPTRYSPPFVQ